VPQALPILCTGPFPTYLHPSLSEIGPLNRDRFSLVGQRKKSVESPAPIARDSIHRDAGKRFPHMWDFGAQGLPAHTPP